MQKSSDPNNSFDAVEGTPPAGGPPPVGGADAVQKTTWVVGEGTDPDKLGAADAADAADAGRAPGGDAAGSVARPGTDEDR